MEELKENSIRCKELAIVPKSHAPTIKTGIEVKLAGNYTVYFLDAELPGMGRRARQLILQQDDLPQPGGLGDDDTREIHAMSVEDPTDFVFCDARALGVEPTQSWADPGGRGYLAPGDSRLYVATTGAEESLEYRWVGSTNEEGILTSAKVIFFDEADFRDFDQVVDELSVALERTEEFDSRFKPMLAWLQDQFMMMQAAYFGFTTGSGNDDSMDFFDAIDEDDSEFDSEDIELEAVSPQLILVRGLPGSGKTTLARTLSELNTCADDFFIEEDGQYQFNPALLQDAHAWSLENAQGLMEMALQSEDSFEPVVVVHNTFSMRWEIEPYLEMFKDGEIQIHVIDLFDGGLTDQELFSRNIHGVPLEGIAKMRLRWEHDWRNSSPIRPQRSTK